MLGTCTVAALLCAGTVSAAAVTPLGQVATQSKVAEPSDTETTPYTAPSWAGLTLAQIQQQLAEGKLSSEGLVSESLARISLSDGVADEEGGLHAITNVNDGALEIARELDKERFEGKVRGPLHGIPVIVKDNLATADQPTTAGNGAMREYVTVEDATAIQRLREAGAVIVAKANLAEFAVRGDLTLSVFGATKNPFGEDLGISGSSGGSAAAVAAGYAPIALGTDTAGSIIGPAANGSLVGYRPSFGMVSLSGVVPGNSATDTVGPIATNVADAALVMEVLAGADPSDERTQDGVLAFGEGELSSGLGTNALKGARIGVPRDWAAYVSGPGAMFEYLTEDGKQIYDAAIEDLRSRGAEIVPIDYTNESIPTPAVPGDPGYELQQFLTETKATVPKEIMALAEPKDVFDFNDVVASPDTTLAELLAELPPTDTLDPAIVAALQGVPQARAEYATLLQVNQIEAIALPATVSGAGLSVDGSTELTSRIGLPGVTVPSGMDAEGRPLGLKLIGERGGDARLLALAADYEQFSQHYATPSVLPLAKTAGYAESDSFWSSWGVPLASAASVLVVGGIAVSVVVARRKRSAH